MYGCADNLSAMGIDKLGCRLGLQHVWEMSIQWRAGKGGGYKRGVGRRGDRWVLCVSMYPYICV